MKNFLFISISIFLSLQVQAFNCNVNYKPSLNDEIHLDENEKLEKMNLTKLLNSEELTISDGDFVIIENIAAGSDNFKFNPKINDPDYTKEKINNIDLVEARILKNELEIPVHLKKEKILKILAATKQAAKDFFYKSRPPHNWNLFNSFLYYESLRLGEEMKFSTPCAMTVYERASISVYTSSLYQNINRSLRNDSKLNAILNFKKIISRALDKLAPFVGVVIRGSNLSEPYLSEHSVGNILFYKGLTSASDGIPFSGDYKFTIQSKQGRDISELSMYPQEKEVLFKPDSSFKIDKRIENEFFMSEQPL